MSKNDVGQQTEKAVDNAIESMAKNIKFKRVVNFSITVLEETCALSGTNNKKNCEFVAQRKGYKQVINVLQNHAANPEFCKKSCVILKELLTQCSDPQLADKMVEGGAAEALQLIIETPPEKDDETKQLVLEILNSLFTVRGVMHKIVAKHGKGILKMFMDTKQTKLAKNVIDCLHNTAGEGLEELDNDSLTKMNNLVMSHQQDLGVNRSGSQYIRNLFESSKPDRIKDCGITVREIVKAFGPHNMDEQVFRNLDVALDKIGSDQEFYSVVDGLLAKPNSDDFWIMSHLVDLPSVDIQSKRDDLDKILRSADSNNLVGSLNAEVCFFLKELHRARPEMSKDLMKDKQGLIRKIMDEIDTIKGPHKFLGLQVLKQNIDIHGKFMRENDIIKKAEKWLKECETPEDMVNIMDFLGAFVDDKDLKNDMLNSDVDELSINNCKNKFPGNPVPFNAMIGFLDRAVTEPANIQQFCDGGNINTVLEMASTMVDDIKDLDKFMNFTLKMFSPDKPSDKLKQSFDQLMRLFSTAFENRITHFFEDWFKNKDRKEVWAQTYRPKFIECISTEEERVALSKIFHDYDFNTLEARIHKFALGEKGMDALNVLSQLIATFVCYLAKEDPNHMTSIGHRVTIDDAIQSLKNNLEFITEKAIKNRVISRYLAMFCALLPAFHQKAFVKKITIKRSEFCFQELINFVEYAVPKQPMIPCILLSAYGLYFIPESLKPEIPKTVSADGEEDKEAAVFQNAVWTPLTFILNDANVSYPVHDTILKIMKNKKTDSFSIFTGFLALAFVYQFGTHDTDLILDSALLTNIIAQIDEQSLNTDLATSAIHSMDSWCEHGEKAIQRLNSIGAYDKLLRYMNDLQSEEILKMVISSLLQKLSNSSDGNQLEYDLERLVKRCKEYDEICDTKGDQEREKIRSVYNELSGLLQLQKAQQYCNNKHLQSITLNTLAVELKKKPEELLIKGLIVNYQDVLRKLISSNVSLFTNGKPKPDDIINVGRILGRSIEKWKNDSGIMKGILELTVATVKKKGQLGFPVEISRKMFSELEDMTLIYKANPEILRLIKEVQDLLETEAPSEPEVQPIPQTTTQDEQPQQTDQQEVPAEPIEETQVQPTSSAYDEEPQAPPEPEPEPEPMPEEEVYAKPDDIEMAEEEQQQTELKESFVTEEIFANTQETHQEERKAIEDSQLAVEESIPEFNEPEPEQPAAVDQPLTDEYNLRVEADRNRAMQLLNTKAENPDDTTQDAYIYNIQTLADALDFDELAIAIFYAKWITKTTSIPVIAYYVGNPCARLLANLDKFEGNPELLKHTCNATSTMSKDNQMQIDNIIASELFVGLKNYTSLSKDPATLVLYAKTIFNLASTEENKITISQKGVIKPLTSALTIVKTDQEAVLKPCFKAVNALCNSKVSCPMNTEKTDFLERLIDFAAEQIPIQPIVCLVLETFGIILKFGGEKVRTRAIDHGATEFFTEVFLTYRDDDSVMKYFYSSAAAIGENPSFWKTLDSAAAFSDFVFAKLTSYSLDMTKSALVCLVFETKIDDICDKTVFNGLYRWLDPTIRTHNDNVVLSFVLVIENAITATMRRQNRLNDEQFYNVVMQYHQEVTATKNEKLLILWLSILCKLTNNKESCVSLMAYLYTYLDGLLREYYYNEPVFEKLYNLMSNILLGSDCPIDNLNTLLSLSFHKLSVGTHTENFMMLYVNFLEKLTLIQQPDIVELLTDYTDSVVGSLTTVPLLLRHISENVQKKFQLHFPRKNTPLNQPPFLRTSLDPRMIDYLHAGASCKRYRPGAVIESGILFLDRQIKHVVFMKTNLLSVLSRDIVFLGDIIKVIKGHDERSSFAEAIKKYNLNLSQEVTLMILSSKISYGETGFYIQFNTADDRRAWKDSLKTLMEEIPQKK